MAGIGNPVIVTGAKGPRVDLGSLQTEGAVEAFIAPRDGEVVFRSRFKEHRLLIRPESKKVIGDEILTNPALTVSFSSFEFRTQDKDVIELLRKHPRFGLNGDFWDQTQAQAVAEETQYQNFVNLVEGNPKLKARLGVDLGLRDFKLGKSKAADEPQD